VCVCVCVWELWTSLSYQIFYYGQSRKQTGCILSVLNSTDVCRRLLEIRETTTAECFCSRGAGGEHHVVMVNITSNTRVIHRCIQRTGCSVRGSVHSYESCSVVHEDKEVQLLLRPCGSERRSPAESTTSCLVLRLTYMRIKQFNHVSLLDFLKPDQTQRIKVW